MTRTAPGGAARIEQKHFLFCFLLYPCPSVSSVTKKLFSNGHSNVRSQCCVAGGLATRECVYSDHPWFHEEGGVTRLPSLFARLTFGLLALWPLAAAANPARASAPHADAEELVLGRVSDNPKVDYAKLQPLLDYVVPRLADVGIRRGRVLMARDNQQMISYLKRGKVDWVTETSGSAMAYQERAGARLMLR